MTDNAKLFVLISVLSIGLLVLAGAIAVGKVEEKTSFGLTGIITIVGSAVLGLIDKISPRAPQKPKESEDEKAK